MIYFQVMKASALVRNSFDIRNAVGVDLSDADSFVLYAISNNNLCTQTDIVYFTNLHKVGVSRSCLKLESLGLVTREAHPGDCRMHLLALTSQGQSVMSNLSIALEEWENRLVRALGGDSGNQVAETVAQLETIGMSATIRRAPPPRRAEYYELLKALVA